MKQATSLLIAGALLLFTIGAGLLLYPSLLAETTSNPVGDLAGKFPEAPSGDMDFDMRFIETPREFANSPFNLGRVGLSSATAEGIFASLTRRSGIDVFFSTHPVVLTSSQAESMFEESFHVSGSDTALERLYFRLRGVEEVSRPGLVDMRPRFDLPVLFDLDSRRVVLVERASDSSDFRLKAMTAGLYAHVLDHRRLFPIERDELFISIEGYIWQAFIFGRCAQVLGEDLFALDKGMLTAFELVNDLSHSRTSIEDESTLFVSEFFKDKPLPGNCRFVDAAHLSHMGLYTSRAGALVRTRSSGQQTLLEFVALSPDGFDMNLTLPASVEDNVDALYGQGSSVSAPSSKRLIIALPAGGSR
ncbi:MAG: hypothetical protein U5N86_01195 [Planctomycetota bacterium]|nr:hypothetical protein [Planctomycetota bacterium]